MGIEVYLAVAGLAAGGASERQSRKETKKSRRAEETALGIQSKQQELSVRREGAQARRRSRAARAEAVSTSVGQTGTTVAGAGAASSATSQGAAEVGYLGQQLGLSQAGVAAERRGVRAQETAAYYGSLANFSFDVFTAAGGFKSIFTGVNKFTNA